MNLGQKLSPILKEIDETLWEHDFHQAGTPKGFTKEDLPAACKIFATVVLEVMWANRDKDKGIEFESGKAEHVGGCIRELVKQSTGIDMRDMIKGER